MLFRFRELGYSVDYLIDFSVTVDLRNSSGRVLDLDQPSLGLARQFLLRGQQDPQFRAYSRYMLNTAVLLGAEREEARTQIAEVKTITMTQLLNSSPRKDLLLTNVSCIIVVQVLEFERQLANISLGREERRDSSRLYNPLTIADLSRLEPSVPWLRYINTLLAGADIAVTQHERVVVEVGSHLYILYMYEVYFKPSLQVNLEAKSLLKCSGSELRDGAGPAAVHHPGPRAGELPGVAGGRRLPALPRPAGAADPASVLARGGGSG